MISDILTCVITFFLVVIYVKHFNLQRNYLKSLRDNIFALNLIIEQRQIYKELFVFAITTIMLQHEENENFEEYEKCRKALEKLNENE
jgi:hypothetical protein